ncbi:hypothetical protein BIV23_24120 [Streptomyces monashensis]|uniref:Transposase n=1 Tax=Streptomyces monashensis TaxID=1678012 RepID=A0A1S2QAY2_9ACTN|nr:hypothetical protein [Streptomyces monashensis]OIK02873.1 hypothetical protein BIV23_24120 [Streptomyces monashensis]
MTTDLNTLLTALYVKTDDEIRGTQQLLSDSELLCLAVTQTLLGYHCQARSLRYACKHLWGRGVENRGRAEVLTVDLPPVAPDHFGQDSIRVRPQKLITWNLEIRGTAALERQVR